MIQRLLLSGASLGVLVGCGGATAPGVVTTANAGVRIVDATHGHQISSAVTALATPGGSPAPAASPKAIATTAPPLVAAAASVAPTQRDPLIGASTAQRPVAAAASALHPRRNLLTGPHGLNTSVGPDYTDCTGDTEVPHGAAARDTCHTGAILFVGHNHGVFTPLLKFVRGDVINWYDGNGALHRLRIVSVRDVSSAAFPPVLGPYEFQTCLYAMVNSPMDRDLDAVEV